MKRKAPLTKAALVRRLKRVQEAHKLPASEWELLPTEGAVVITVNRMVTKPESNSRVGWRADHEKRLSQHAQVKMAMHAAQSGLFTAGGVSSAHEVPRVVTLTRLAPLELDDDNNINALKAVRDAVARWFAVDDGPRGPIRWAYGYRKRRVAGVEVRLSWAEPERTVLEEVEALLPAARDAVPTYPATYLRAMLGTRIGEDVVADATGHIARLVAALEAARKDMAGGS